MEQERIVKGIWIPIEVWKNKDLNWNEKILLLEIDSFSSNEKDCFISNQYISELLGINETNASKTLSSLVEKGYVVRTRFDGKHRYVKSALSQTTTLHCQERQPSRVSDSNIIINLDNITNTTTEKEIKKKEDLDWSIVSPQMVPVVKEWLAYKKEKGQSYKPTGFRTFYKKLCEMSSNDPQIAMLIIEQSMQNNYAGIFPLRNNNNNSNNYGRVKTNSDRFIESAKAANEFSQMLRENIGKQTELGDGDSSAVW